MFRLRLLPLLPHLPRALHLPRRGLELNIVLLLIWLLFVFVLEHMLWHWRRRRCGV